jgi:hypothetical protein
MSWLQNTRVSTSVAAPAVILQERQDLPALKLISSIPVIPFASRQL